MRFIKATNPIRPRRKEVEQRERSGKRKGMEGEKSREKLKNSWALQINWKWNRMWTATWTLGERRLSIQCQPKRGRQGTERDEEKRWKKKQSKEILANRQSNRLYSSCTLAVPYSMLVKKVRNWLRQARLLTLSISLSLCLPISAHILLYSSLCLPLSFSTSLCLSAPLSATEIWDLWIRRKIKKFHIALEQKIKRWAN